jgi:uncharacterized protein Usg
MEIIGLFNTLADFKAWWQASPDGDLSDLHAVADKRLVPRSWECSDLSFGQ